MVFRGTGTGRSLLSRYHSSLSHLRNNFQVEMAKKERRKATWPSIPLLFCVKRYLLLHELLALIKVARRQREHDLIRPSFQFFFLSSLSSNNSFRVEPDVQSKTFPPLNLFRRVMRKGTSEKKLPGIKRHKESSAVSSSSVSLISLW